MLSATPQRTCRLKEMRCSQCEKPLKSSDLVVRGFFPDLFHVGCVPACSTCGDPFAVGEQAVLWRVESDGRRLMVHAGHESLPPARRLDAAATTGAAVASTTTTTNAQSRECESVCEREAQSDTDMVDLELDDDEDDEDDDEEQRCGVSAARVKLAMAALANGGDLREQQLVYASGCKLYGALGVGVDPGVGMPVGLGVCAGLCGGMPGCGGCAFGQLAYGLGAVGLGAGLGDAASVSSAANTCGAGGGAGGPKRPRTILTMGQRRKFKQAFELNPKPSRKVCVCVCVCEPLLAFRVLLSGPPPDLLASITRRMYSTLTRSLAFRNTPPAYESTCTLFERCTSESNST